ncbi:MAG: hypothetical protein PHU85_04030, partial [Phycisphaerae bacterium]|nr:hypothetical protein [Phycisphaerae bacterium]
TIVNDPVVDVLALLQLTDVVPATTRDLEFRAPGVQEVLQLDARTKFNNTWFNILLRLHYQAVQQKDKEQAAEE